MPADDEVPALERDKPPGLRSDVPLAPLCSLGLGGRAARFIEASDGATVREALAWAASAGAATSVLAGGTNVVVADGGCAGLVLRVTSRGISARREDARLLVTAAAGESWDELVAWSVAENAAGLECLSGIPGSVGATPVQNVGAYGQEVGERIVSVCCLERSTGREVDLPGTRCAFAYRGSLFRRSPARYVILSVTFALEVGGAPSVRYPELRASLGGRSRPSLAAVRAAVLELRRAKSMLLAPDDPNRRSVGSFFTNPIVTPEAAEAVRTRVARAGQPERDMPTFVTADGRVKLSAAWLVERAGFPRGTRRGPVGLSTRHALALVHHGGGTTAGLLAFANEIRAAVAERFGVALAPEPAFLGFPSPPLPDALLV